VLGIKQNRFQIYMSAAYLASLGTTVLIVYVMNPPVSNAVQGAYVVAVIMTGLIIGAAAIFFKELTEGLGCLLGGYSLSMWLLTLKRGGLIQSTGGKAGFVTAFTVIGFATSFSHHTRPYGLIVLISFGGATAVVLGIDCFSRAGLKEFWAWIWNINDDLFPLGATTYPLTKGMKVESAAIIVLFLAGVVSQMKLWKIIKERRELRAKERLVDEQNNQKEEENVGRRIENHAAEERNRWEAIYGDKDTVTVREDSIRDSGFGDGESQKRGPTSTTTSLKRPEEDNIEMAEITPTTPTFPTSAGLVMPKKDPDVEGPEQSKGHTEEPVPIGGHETPAETLKRLSNASKRSSARSSQVEEPVWVATGNGDARLERRPSQQGSFRNSVRSSLRKSRRVSAQSAASPEESHSPIVPEIEVEDDRSIAATVADEEPAQKIDSRRLSASSALLLRSASNRSKRSSKRFSKGDFMEDALDDRASSVGATMDDCSDDEMMSRRSSLRSVLSVHKRGSRPKSAATVATNILDLDALRSSEHSQDQDAQTEPQAAGAGTEDAGPAASAPTEKLNSAPITSDRLPSQLPKVALNFRTNEWAKHISADLPPEEAPVPPSPTSPSTLDTEEPAPVNVSALQETTPLPQARRSASALSVHAVGITAPQARSGTPQNQFPFPRINSQQSLNRLSTESLLSTRARGIRSSSTPGIPQVIAEGTETDMDTGTEKQRLSSAPLSSSAARNTLLGQRDSMIRNKSSFYGISNNPYASTQLNSMPEQARSSSQIHLNSSSRQSLVNDEEGDNISLRARQSQLRQSSSPYPYPSPYMTSPIPHHTPSPSPYQHPPQQTRHQSSDKLLQSQQQREARLSHFRQSVAMDLQAGKGEEAEIEERRTRLWQNRLGDAERREYEEKMKIERERERQVNMQRSAGSGGWLGGGWNGQGGGGPDMMERHREAMRRMQARAG